MAAIRPMAFIKEKWVTVTPTKAPQYEQGVQNPKKDWATNAKEAEEAWKAGVTAAAGEGRFGRGVERAGTKKWQERALRKGPTRYAEGTMIAGDDYERGFKPYRDVIERTELPKRQAKGSRANIERVWAIASALHEAKKAGV